MGNPLPVSLSQECRKAQKIINEFVDPVRGLDSGVIPLHVLRRAKGFAIFSVFRIGALLSARAGSGLVLAKTEDGEWSPPAAVGLGGLGGGFNAGAEVTDFLIVLNSRSAVRSFMANGSLQLGGNMSLAVGPLGRSAEASGSISSDGGAAAMFSYSKSKGLYGGISIEGTILVDRGDANAKAYGRRDITSKIILSGNVDTPEFARPLLSTIERLTRSGGDVGAGMDGDFRNMGIGGGAESSSADNSPRRRNKDIRGDDYYGGGGRYSPGADGQRYDDYGRPVLKRGDSTDSQDDYGEPYSAAGSSSYGRGGSGGRGGGGSASMARQWSDQDRSRKHENETRNVGAYAFGPGTPAQDQNNPFDDAVAAAPSSPSTARSRMSPSFTRARASSRATAASNYAKDDEYGVDRPPSSASSASRPKHGRKGSSFSFSSFRKTPPPSAALANYQYDHEADGLRDRDRDRDREAASPSWAASTRKSPKSPRSKLPPPKPVFPTNFDNDPGFTSSSAEDVSDDDRRAERGAARSSTAGSGGYGRSKGYGNGNGHAGGNGWRDDLAPIQSGSSSSEVYTWNESDGGRERERYLDAFDRELQQSSASASASRSRAGTSGSGGTKRNSGGYYNGGGSSSGAARAGTSPVAGRSANNTSRSSFRASSRGSRAETPTWARNLNFPGGAGAGAGAAAERDAFERAYPDAGRRKISSYTPPPAGKPVSAPSPSRNAVDLPSANGDGDHVIAQFDFGGAEAGDLAFKRGDVIEVLRRTASREDWWDGRCRGRVGSFPANYTQDL